MSAIESTPGRKYVNRAGDVVLQTDFGSGPVTYHLTDRTTGASISLSGEHLAFLCRDAKLPMSVSEDDLDIAAERAFEASHMVHGTKGTHRDFKTQIVEWRAVANAAIASALPIVPQLLPTDHARIAMIDDALGLNEGATADDRFKAIVELVDPEAKAIAERRERLRPIADFLGSAEGPYTMLGLGTPITFERALIMHSFVDIGVGEEAVRSSIAAAQEDGLEDYTPPLASFIDSDTLMLVGQNADPIDEADDDAFSPGRSIILETNADPDLDARIDLDSIVSTEVDSEGSLVIRMEHALLMISKSA